jgi:hypothetical protein
MRPEDALIAVVVPMGVAAAAIRLATRRIALLDITEIVRAGQRRFGLHWLIHTIQQETRR